MLTKEEVDRQIQGDYEKYYNSPCPFEIIPELPELFKKAFMASAFGQHQVNPDKLDEMIATPVNMLNMAQVGIMMNFLVNIPARMIADDFESAKELHRKLFDFKVLYNKDVDRITKELARKTNKLYEIAGLGKSSVSYRPQDNLQIIKK